MEQEPRGMLLLTGTIGSGKTAIAVEIGNQLEGNGLPCAVIDLDWLGWVCLGNQFHSYDHLSVQNLLSIWPNLHSVGVEYLVMARAFINPEPIETLQLNWPATSLTVIRLTASSATLSERIRRRDTGDTLHEHLSEVESMNIKLDNLALEHVTVANDERSITDVAEQVIALTGWRH